MQYVFLVYVFITHRKVGCSVHDTTSCGRSRVGLCSAKPEQVQQADIDAGELVTTVVVSSSDSLESEDTVSITSIVTFTRINAFSLGEIE